MKTHVLAFVATGMLAGCAVAPTNVAQIDRLESVGDNPRIVMMPPDIRYYLLTAGGVSEPHAEWTTAAQQNFADAALAYSDSIGADMTLLDADDLSADEIRYETLHSAVGMTMLQHYFFGTRLPSKGDKFDWSLGPEISVIGKENNADYALFVFYRDYQASGGRVGFAVLSAVVGAATGTGAMISTGSESGFASLVDLTTGEIVWFNLVAAGSGEMRDKDGAAVAVAKLFADIPTSQGSAETQ
jgi:hypothetical protein